MSYQQLNHLSDYLPELSYCESSLSKSLQHALSTEGSLSRARLAFCVGTALGLDEGVAVRLAAGVEFFHLSSLILDDMPCMDNATTRRGRQCVHVVHGEHSAILASLALINRSYSLIWSCLSGLDSEASKEACSLVDECLGLSGIINGQAMDLAFKETGGSPEAIERIAMEKTGSLFRLCLLLPALVAGAGRYEKMHLARLAGDWGVAYQAADDLKDVLLGENVSGKTPQRDALLGRPNIALAQGVEKTLSRLQARIDQARASVNALMQSGESDWSVVDLFQKEFEAKVEKLSVRQSVA